MLLVLGTLINPLADWAPRMLLVLLLSPRGSSRLTICVAVWQFMTLFFTISLLPQPTVSTNDQILQQTRFKGRLAESGKRRKSIPPNFVIVIDRARETDSNGFRRTGTGGQADRATAESFDDGDASVGRQFLNARLPSPHCQCIR